MDTVKLDQLVVCRVPFRWNNKRECELQLVLSLPDH